jgi:hypothetical protein
MLFFFIDEELLKINWQQRDTSLETFSSWLEAEALYRNSAILKEEIVLQNLELSLS